MNWGSGAGRVRGPLKLTARTQEKAVGSGAPNTSNQPKATLPVKPVPHLLGPCLRMGSVTLCWAGPSIHAAGQGPQLLRAQPACYGHLLSSHFTSLGRAAASNAKQAGEWDRPRQDSSANRGGGSAMTGQMWAGAAPPLSSLPNLAVPAKALLLLPLPLWHPDKGSFLEICLLRTSG